MAAFSMDDFIHTNKFLVSWRYINIISSIGLSPVAPFTNMD